MLFVFIIRILQNHVKIIIYLMYFQILFCPYFYNRFSVSRAQIFKTEAALIRRHTQNTYNEKSGYRSFYFDTRLQTLMSIGFYLIFIYVFSVFGTPFSARFFIQL